jgi:hypothetical protein
MIVRCVLLAALITTGGMAALSSTVSRDRDPAPLPSMDQVLRRVILRAEVEPDLDREFKRHYAYRLIRVKDEFNAKDQLRKREHRNRTHVPRPDTVPSPRSRSDSSRAAPEPSGPVDESEAAAAMQQGRAFNRNDFPVTPELLDRFTFTLVGRDPSANRSTLIIDFEPASANLPVRQFKDRFVNRAAGRVWIDETDWALARAELRLVEPVPVVGGLVGTVRRCRYQLVRDRTPDGYWHPISVDWRLEGRQFLSRKAIEYRERMEDLQRVIPTPDSQDL